MSKSFENLKIWKNALDLAETMYRVTRSFPREETFGLTSQLRRAVVSISANIAEGVGRNTKPETSRFVDIALGSLNETESLSALAYRLGYIPSDSYKKIRTDTETLGRSISAFRKYLKR